MRFRSIPRALALFGAFAVMVGFSVSAGAQVSFHPPDPNVPGNPDENVLFNQSPAEAVLHPLGPGNPIYGRTNNTNQWVKIEGTEPLLGNGGQANYIAVDGAMDFSRISLQDPANTLTAFTWFQVNLDVDNAINGATIVFKAITVNNAAGFLSPALALDANGVNRFDILAEGGDRILAIEWQVNPAEAIVDSIQLRLGGVQSITAVPEPSSMALLAGGALPLFGFMRRRRR